MVAIISVVVAIVATTAAVVVAIVAAAVAIVIAIVAATVSSWSTISEMSFRSELSTTTMLTEVVRPEVCTVPMSRVHPSEEMSSTIAVPSPGVAEIPVVVVVVGIDSESPSVVVEGNWAIEIIYGHEPAPLIWSEKCLECEVACSAYGIVVVGAISESDVVEIVVYSGNIVIVDVIEVVENLRSESEGVAHPVG